MKTFLLLFVFSCITILTNAQAPQSFKYQAIVRDISNNILSNQNVALKILILESSSSGNVVFSETHNVITNNFGLINLEIGTGTLLAGNFSTINWGGNSHYVRIELDENGGSNFQLMGTSQLLSVPYALYAESSGGAGQTYTAGSGISITGNVISNISPDQNVMITGSGSTSVSGTYPNFTISSTDNVNDADFDPTNEIQTVSQTGTNVTLSNGGGTFSVSDGDTSLWKMNGNDIYRGSGLVGIGVNNPLYKLHINDTLNDVRTTSVQYVAQGGSTSNNVYRGLNSQIYGTSGTNRAIQAYSGGSSTGSNVAFAGFSDSAVTNFGLISVTGNYSTTTGTNYGIYSLTNGSSFGNAGIFSQIGENTNGASNNGIVSYVYYNNNVGTNVGIRSSVNNSLINNTAVRAEIGNISYTGTPNSSTSNNSISTAVSASNNGTGGTTTYGVNAYAIGGSVTNFGVYGQAGGNPPTNSYSIYGQEGSTNLVNYAGYFNGKVTITGTLSNPSDKRLKSNITSLNSRNILDKLLKLNVYSYKYNAQGDYKNIALPEGIHYGVIAQELEDIFPQIVSEQFAPISDTIIIKTKDNEFPNNITSKDNSNAIKNTSVHKNDEYVIAHNKIVSYKAVNYIEIIPLLLQGIQEQQVIIENQNEEVVKLNNRLLILEEQIQQLLNK